MSAEESRCSSSSSEESSERNSSLNGADEGGQEERLASLRSEDEIDVDESASDLGAEDRGGIVVIESNGHGDEGENEKDNSTRLDDGLAVIESNFGTSSISVEAGEGEGAGSNAEVEIFDEARQVEDAVPILMEAEVFENELEGVDSLPVLEMKPELTRLRTRSISGIEIDEQPSPRSSGYAGERGSSNGAASSASDINEIVEDDEIREIGNEDGGNGGLDSHVDWVPRKRYVNEDDASVSWRRRKKHFFILSNSGKPIYSRYGDEHKLAGFSATLQAIISFVENGGDHELENISERAYLFGLHQLHRGAI